MNAQECIAVVEEVLLSLPYIRQNFSVRLSPERSPGGAGAGGSVYLPPLLINCRDSREVPAYGVEEIPVDNLGSSSQVSAMGYFQGGEGAAGGGSIHLLVDRLQSPQQAGSLLRHELVHAMDHAIHGLDMGTCAGLACSEVRASAAGECAGMWPEFRRSLCIRGAAATSTSMVFPQQGRLCAGAMLPACIRLDALTSPVPAVQHALSQEQGRGDSS
jgi:hypothetical protein